MTKTSRKTARYAAAETLLRLRRTHFPVKPLLDTVVEECGLAGPERGLAMNLVYGVLRQKQYLDHLLEKLCKRPLEQLDPFVHTALQTGLYQLFCLDRIPESAAVNETVNAVKASGLKKHLQGFVNGVLRAAIRQREQLPQPGDPSKDGKLILNHPDWLTSRWLSAFGREEMERICSVNNMEPQLVLRINTAITERDEFIAELGRKEIPARPGLYAPDSVMLPGFQGSVSGLPGYEQGKFQVQDEAAQLATLLLGPFDNGLYLDACAGLGGKTSHLMQLLGPAGRIMAVEPEPQRQRLLKENISRLFPDRTLTIHATSLQDYCRTSRLQFDRILVDAPCSGTGVIGRHPDIRWNREEDELQRYQQQQLEILQHAADLVAPDGVLVYATCSLEAEENDQVIEHFLTRHKHFALTDCRDYLPESAASLTGDGFFHPHPSESIDGFFAARLQRSG